MMGNRGLNTSRLIVEMKTRCVWKQDKINGHMKNGVVMARKLVTSIAERRPKQGEEPTSAEVNTMKNPHKSLNIPLSVC
jgi:hypothetical protein